MTRIEFIKFSDDEFNIVKDIRNDVFVSEQGVNPNEEFDIYDNMLSTDYALLYLDDMPASTGRIIVVNDKYKIGRIAVLKEYRAMHLGKLLVSGLIEKARQMGANSIFVDAQLHAIPFYEKLGFKVFSSDIVDRGIIHRPMKLDEDLL